MTGKKYMCRDCGYIYDPASGDKFTGIGDGLSFEDLPSGWLCPVCGVSKADFVPW
ncbi:MAG: rubredoxin [Nitrospirae bacterium]|nr:rubredoxin [Nitrospirota bacterium]